MTFGRSDHPQQETSHSSLTTAALTDDRGDGRLICIQREREVFEGRGTIFAENTAAKNLGNVTEY